ncbi:Uncharacterized protein APZ42_015845 [Daphnia magna]|uniref:Uncharacterized protein n=2 Tax=Daphnia magna TaxID=35525 RepID=A0A0P5YXQ7_9CRUS|nr:hypothetical protein OUZ56_006402 [Daphnia magna]KZS17871.1 Uncharacterized protein APZ42_015845 [Daphnia magna]
MEKTCYFFQIPTEVMCMIVSHLSIHDRISFKFAYPHFFCQHRHINVREAFACSEENIEKILHNYNPDVVTKLDFNYCYWLSGKEISDFARSCSNLKELSVAHTNIDISDVAEVLSENVKLSKLSLSIANPESYWCTEQSVIDCLQQLQEDSEEMSGKMIWQNLLSLSQLGTAKESLAQLSCLDLHIGQNPVILGTILSACKNLENLSIRLTVEQEKLVYPEDLKIEDWPSRKTINNLLESFAVDSAERYCPLPPRSLKSIVVLVHNKSRTLEGPMEQFIQKIVDKSSSYIQCLWAAIPFLTLRDMGFNIKNMIAWKETKNFSDIVLRQKRLPFMESLASNKYMQRGDFNLPQLKQIECGFWKDNFASFCRAHPLLERLRLNKRPCEVSELYSIIDWSRLPPIRVLSLHSRIIYASDYLQNSWMRNRAERALCMLLNKCPSLEELEICPDFNESPDALIRNSRETFLTADSLSGLTLCLNLKKFSLVSVKISYKREEINDTSLLEEIVTKCPNLESLKIQDLSIGLTHHGATERKNSVLETLYWSCIERCCLTLRSAHKLRLLRWKMRIVSQAFDQLIRLLAYCPSLVQLGLVASSVHCGLDMYSWNESMFASFFVELVQHLPKLIALLVVLPGAPTSHCVAATAALESTFRPTRPCFCAQITDSLSSANPPSLPWIHYQALACDSYTSVGELPYHFTTSDSHY